jgi:hypothetical protein
MDLFEHYEMLPSDASKVYWKYAEIGASDGFGYDTCAEFLKEMNAVGYTFEYGLDGEPFNLTKIKNNIMLEILRNKLDKLQDINLNLMVDKLNGNTEVIHDIYINVVLQRKLHQMIKQFSN